VLDLAAAAAQVAALSRQLRHREAELPARTARALADLSRLAASPLPELPHAVRRWAALPDGSPADAGYPPASLPKRLTVTAVDGSQIEPDFHDFSGCCLINVGWTVFHYGGPRAAVEMASRPTTCLAGVQLDGTTVEDEAPAAGPHARSIEVRRMLAEVEQLADLVASPPGDRPLVALVDGPLIAYWVLNLLEGDLRQAALSAYARLFTAARTRRAALAGYISRSRSAEVTHLVRAALCASFPAPGLCEACRARFPHPGSSPPPCYAAIDGVADRHLFMELLPAGERSAVFRPAGAGLVELAAAGHELRFFYLRAGDDLARVEVPAWVAADDDLLTLLHAALLEQATLGGGYPLALCEAHEQAVVRGPDRDVFSELVRRSCSREGLHGDLSPKLRAKRQPVG
jgi:hypothetical protein